MYNLSTKNQNWNYNMSKIGIILCILIFILISIRYFDPFDKGLADWEKCKESLLTQVFTNKCTPRQLYKINI